MIQNILKPNIIRASAGTGKTYRLSLEYIALLLKLKDQISFDQILVITFTIKATAEIRLRIVEFLKQIISNGKKAEELKNSLSDIYPDLEFSDQNITFLKSVYRKIITHKSRLNISTLDSFINTVFKTLIAPYHNLSDYSIDPEINDNYLPELYDHILSDQNFAFLEGIFKTKLSRNISSFDEFIKAVIQKRWLFEFYSKANITEIDHSQAAEEAYIILGKAAKEFCQSFHAIYSQLYSDKPYNKVFSKIWWDTLNDYQIRSTESIHIISLFTLFQDKNFLVDNYKLLAKTKNIWNGVSLFRKKTDLEYKEELITLQEALFNAWRTYLFFELVIPEQNNIIKLSKVIYHKYDQIKFREKILTYDDLTTYTWKALHDPKISMISDQDIINLFYEQLSTRIRFILIDEFQDTSILQWNIFTPLIREVIAGSGASEQGSFTVVGDEKQAIYSWRHGERELLMNMKNLIPADFRDNELDRSYRSSTNIVDFVNCLFQDNFFTGKINEAGLDWYYGKGVESHKEDEGYVKIQITNLKNDEDDLDFRLAVKSFIQNNYLPFISENNQYLDPANTAILTRSHNEMKIVSQVLSELDINHITETSHSILDHRTIIPIISLLRWFHNQDFFSLIIFLRSDAVRLDSASLKKILISWQKNKQQNTSFLIELYNNIADIPAIDKIAELSPLICSTLQLIKAIIHKFNLTSIFSQEADLSNFTKFIDLTANFLAANLDYTHDLGGLLRWYEDSRKSEAFIQASIQQQNVLKLLTVHAAKGLEFDTVIFIHQCTKNTAHLPELTVLPNYSKDFSSLNGCIFTYNFHSLIQNSPVHNLYVSQLKREKEEAINIWYVALTRPKRNLLSLITYARIKGLADYIESFDNENPDIDKLMIGAIVNSLSNSSVSDADNFQAEIGKLLPSESKEDQDTLIHDDAPNISGWFSPPPENFFVPKNDCQNIIPAADRQKLAKAKTMGNIAHYYLENIRFDTPDSRQLALNRTLAFYGSLVHQDIIRQITAQINDFLDTHYQYFSPDIWDNIFCEFSIFDQNGREYRIDRLLVSHQRKEIMVVDYKTGKITSPDQICKYNDLLKTIPFVIQNNYTVKEGVFLKIEL